MKKYYRYIVIFLLLSCWMSHVAFAQVVRVPDPNLAAKLREDLGLGPNEPITRQEMQRLIQWSAIDRQITDITGMEHATRLRALSLNNNEISDLSPLARLTQLEQLSITANQIQDISALSRLTRLWELWLGANKIRDLSPLTRLTNLEVLSLGINQIRDVRPLARLRRLKTLHLSYNRIIDVSPLAGLTELTELYLAGNPIQDTSPLARLTKLVNVDFRVTTRPPEPTGKDLIPDSNLASAVREALGLGANATITKQAMRSLTTLFVHGRQIKDITGLEHATQLRGLSLNFNEIRDIRPLAGLTQLKVLWLTLNQISDLTPLARLTHLETLYLGRNQITDVSPLAGLIRLKELILTNNKIRDVSALSELVNLEKLWLAENPIQDTSPLASLRKLRDVDIKISKQPVADLDLTEAGPKIEGPWTWMIISTGRIGGADAVTSGIDYLERASKGTVTETQIATHGVMPGDRIKNKTWTSGKLSPMGRDNITETLNAIGLRGNRENFVAYGSISLHSPRKQNTTMYVGSDDAVKVWLNGKLVHNNPIDRSATDYQDAFPVTLKKGENILLVAVYERTIDWSGFFGFKRGTKYSLPITPVVQIGPTQRPAMYWIDANTGTLHRLIGNEVENFISQVQNATSLVVDAANNIIYWTEQLGRNKGSIKRANLDGSNVQVLATPNGVPNSIAVDSMRGRLYWTDSRGRIQRSNLNGRQIRNLIRNLDAPETITVDVAGGKLYWTEASGRIRSANLNGKSIQNIASGLGTLSSIAISGNKIYYGTTLPGESRGSIGRVNLNGSNLRTIASLQSTLSGIAIDPVGNKLYWTESDGYMWRANLNGRNTQEVVSGLTSPAHLVVGSPGSRIAAAPMNSSLASSEPLIPDATDLLSNYPNPFNPETWIPYQLSKSADVRITIYNVRGTVVRHLALGHQAAGVYQSRSRAAYWDGRNAVGEPVASGVYFYTLTAGHFTATRKMLIRK